MIGVASRVMRAFALLLVLSGALLPPSPAGAQEAKPARTWRIGWLSPPTAATGASELAALRAGLRELKYVEGQNLVIEARWANGDPARLADLARSLAELPVDVICTAGTPATLAAKRATSTVPIVFGRAAFPEQTGLVSSLARPGGNLTGVTFIGPEYGKRLELLREVAPRASRIALLYNDRNTASVLAVEETRRWAKDLRVTIEPVAIHDAASLDAALASLRRHPPEALMTTADPLVASFRGPIVGFAAERRVVAMFGDREYVRDGGLMFYGTSTADMWHHAATYVDRILRGAKPGELPVEQPTKFELMINMKTARVRGLAIPPSLLLRADEILE